MVGEKGKNKNSLSLDYEKHKSTKRLKNMPPPPILLPLNMIVCVSFSLLCDQCVVLILIAIKCRKGNEKKKARKEIDTIRIR